MVTIAQRIEALRTERNLSRPALASALGFPKNSIEKFETGRQTPTMAQQEKIAAYFGILPDELQGGSQEYMSAWMDDPAYMNDHKPISAPKASKVAAPVASSGEESGSMFDAFLTSKKFQDALRTAALDILKTPEGQKVLEKAVRREISKLER